MSRELEELLQGNRDVCSVQSYQAIKDFLRNPFEPNARSLAILRLASKFGIHSETIDEILARILPEVELYDIAYVKRFESHKLLPQQYVAAIRSRLPGVDLYDIRDVPGEIHLLAGSVIGFRVGDVEWRSGNRVRFTV
jgi:hypothetical protein